MRLRNLGDLVAIAFLGLTLAGAASGQIVFDGSLGAPGAAPLDPADPSGQTFLVDRTRGLEVSSGGRRHLFHSFLSFDVPNAHTAAFTASDGTQAIVSRVTGGQASSLAGTLRVRTPGGGPGPDLFLLNPNGVLFTGNVRLDLDASLFASTADAIRFEDGALFSARPGGEVPMSAAPPASLRFAAGSSNIELADVSLVSNDVGGARFARGLTLAGASVRTSGPGRIVAEEATVGIAAMGDGAAELPLDLESFDVGAFGGTLGRVALGGPGTTFQVSTTSPGQPQGRIVIRGGELALVEGSLRAGGDGSLDGRPAIDVAVQRDVWLDGSTAKIESLTNRDFGPASVRISAEELGVRNGASILITTNELDAGLGRIEIAVDRLAVDGLNSRIKSTTGDAGAGGAIEVSAGSIEVTNAGEIVSDALFRPGGVVGPGGDITLVAESILVSDFSQVKAGADGSAQGGHVRLEADTVRIEESSIVGTGPSSLDVPQDAQTGAAGDVTILADVVEIVGGSQVTATTEGSGSAGNVRIEAGTLLEVSGSVPQANRPSGIFARSGLGFGSAATGDAGSITIEAGSLRLADGAEIGARTFGSGNAGAIEIDVAQSVEVVGARITSESTGLGISNDIAIAAGKDVWLRAGAEIRSEATVPRPLGGPNDPPTAGDVVIRAGRVVGLDGARITTDSARPESGRVELEGRRAVVLRSSDITTNVDSDAGRGGDVTIRTDALVLEDATVQANAMGTNADAGDIAIRADDGILRAGTNVLEARAELGVDGRVDLQGPVSVIGAELAAVSARYRTAAEEIRDACLAQGSVAGSFAVRAVAERPSPETSRDASDAPGYSCDGPSHE